uniref:myelin and lymphocyte protein-like isoform X1 n=1 Tax=Oncorhynchus gorbuscha TaxID=8017 RepID=UPI001EAEE797|nr:myelin and lymphocyte protein-like isoform X1 [Oncorhynchus gorbuscha]
MVNITRKHTQIDSMKGTARGPFIWGERQNCLSRVMIFGGLVWTLVASTKVLIANPQGWVMFVSVFCFIFTTLWFFIFISGANKSSIWPTLDVVYHSLAAFFYLSAAVVQAYITISLKSVTSTFFKEYQLDIAAVVMCYVVTLLYALHAIFSTMRWKSSS